MHGYIADYIFALLQILLKLSLSPGGPVWLCHHQQICSSLHHLSLLPCVVCASLTFQYFILLQTVTFKLLQPPATP